jgi:Fe-S-cluster containining protein
MISKDGFCYTFNESACATCGGACCIGESGYIWVTRKEIEAISKELNLPIEEFSKEYLIYVKNRYSLKEYNVGEFGYACIFFDMDKRLCKIYNSRPKQCRTFPFWEDFKNNTKELIKECPGVILDEKES